MKTGRNRFGRQDHPRLGRAEKCERRRRSARWITPLLVGAAVFLAAPATQAATGGASTAASGETQAGSGIAFAPMQWAGATWYGPGLYGNHTACGQMLGPNTIGVANRSLPCGTTVKFVYHGRSIVTQVIDRGPYSHGSSWDLTLAAARALHFDQAGADRLRVAVSLEYAAKWRSERPSAR
ncbi:MAG TPA: septal ring lytic transglycosylase RlpA family protein [Solirubrobacterales bacterium]|nr:septal ring lytic transglycosylase RlpA family protein [Solirubrobacterales bacterium]